MEYENNPFDISESNIPQNMISNDATGMQMSPMTTGTIVWTCFTIVAILLTLGTVTTGVIFYAHHTIPIAPFCKNDLVTTSKNKPIKIRVLDNDYDVENQPLYIKQTTNGLHGTIMVVDNKYIIYYPFAGYGGQDKFEYQVTNNKAYRTCSVQVKVLNSVPTCIPIAFQVSKNSRDNIFSIFTFKDEQNRMIIDTDNDPISLSSTTMSSQNANIQHDDNNIYYTPASQFTGLDIFNYTVFDGNDTCIEQVQVTVYNLRPIPLPDTITIPKNQVSEIHVLNNDGDPNGDDLSISWVGSVGKGNAVFSSDNKYITYFPLLSRETITDSFEYGITDGDLSSSSYVLVTIENRAPSCSAYNQTISKNRKGVSLPLEYSDPDTIDPLTLAIVQVPEYGIVTLQETTYTLGEQFLIDGFVYTDYKNYTLIYDTLHNGVYQDSFVLRVIDSGGLYTEARYNIKVKNDPPTVPDLIQVWCSVGSSVYIDVISGAFDINGDTIRIQAINTNASQVTDGQVIVYNETHVLYTSPPSYVGTSRDYFEYILVDGDDEYAASTIGKVKVLLGNDPPVAYNDYVINVTTNSTILIDVLQNDTDPNGDNIYIYSYNSTSVRGASVNLVDQVVAGIRVQYLQYRALSGASYNDSFTYSIIDEYDATSMEPATVFIQVQNTFIPTPAPLAVSDVYTVKWNQSLTLYVLSNDTSYDTSGTSLGCGNLQVYWVSPYSPIGNASLSITGSGNTIHYIAPPGFVGTDVFYYRNRDVLGGGGGISNKANVTIQVQNGAPICNSTQSTKHSWSGPITIPIACSDPDGNPLSIISVTSANGASVPVGSNGLNIQYNNRAGFSGIDVIYFMVTDWNKQTSGNITVNVTNITPVTRPDTLTLHWNDTGIKTISVLDNDVDPDHDILTLVSASANVNTLGTFQIFGNNLVYQASGNAQGNLIIKYIVSDGIVNVTESCTITITNTHTPQATLLNYTRHWREVQSGIAIKLLSSVIDQDNDLLSFTLSSSSSLYMSITSQDTVQYTRNQWVGTDTISYTLSDGLNTSSSNIVIKSYNNAPLVQNVTKTICGQTIVTGIPISIMDRLVSDPDVNDLAYLTMSSYTNPYHGSLSWNPVLGQFHYTPVSNYSGNDTIKFTITDGLNYTAAYIFINVCYINKTNIYHNVDIPWSKQTTGTNLIIPINGTLLSVTGAQQHGISNIINSSAIYYKQSMQYVGDDQIDLLFSDTNYWGLTNEVHVIINVYDNAPSIRPLVYSNHWRFWLQPRILNPLQNASDVDGDVLTISAVQGSQYGVSTIVTAGTRLQYQATGTGFQGTDLFSLSVTDTIYTTSTSIQVTSTNNNKPQANNIVKTVPWRNVTLYNLVIPILSTSLDADNDTLVLSITSITSGATVSVVNSGNVLNGAIQYSHSNWIGQDVIIYSVSDGMDTSVASITINVGNSIPIARQDYYTVHWRVAQAGLMLNILGNDTDVDGDPLVIASFGFSVLGATVSSINGNTAVWYQYQGTNLGVDVIQYSITDSITTSTPSNFQVTIRNTAPTTNAVSSTTLWRLPTSITLNCTDADNDPIVSYTLLSTPMYGSYTLVGNVLTYVPSIYTGYVLGPGGKYTENDIFTYACSDGMQTTSNTVTVQVYNTAPTLQSDTYTFVRNYLSNPVRQLNVLANDVDLDGDTLLLASVSSSDPSDAVSISSDGKYIQYQPTATKASTSTLTYTVTDGNLQATAFATVTVINNSPVCNNVTRNNLYKNSNYKWYLLNDAACTDANNDPLSFTITSTTVKGILTIGSDAGGSFITYTTKSNRSGQEVITFSVSDGIVNVPYRLTVNIVNRAPQLYPFTTSIPFISYSCSDPSDVTITSTKTTGLIVNPGDMLYTGYTWRYPKDHVGSNVGIYSVNVTYIIKCPGGIKQYYSIFIDDRVYSLNVNDKNWYPEDDPKKPASYQDISPIPDMCNGASMDISLGAIFQAEIYSSNLDDRIEIKFHYGDALNTPWSSTATLIPKCVIRQIPFPTYYWNLFAGASDPDGDVLTLLSINSYSNCLTKWAGTTTISTNGTIAFTQRVLYQGTCWFSYIVRDNDLDNPNTVTVNSNTVTLVNYPPVATADYFKVNQGKELRIDFSDLLANDTDVNGNLIQFDNIVCNNPGVTCTKTFTIDWNNNFMKIPADANTCGRIYYQYRIKTPGDGLTAIGNITVQYTNCKCKTANNVIFVVDGSSSVTSTQWTALKQFGYDIVNRFEIKDDKVRVGFIQYASSATYTNPYGFDVQFSGSTDTMINARTQVVQTRRSPIAGIDKAVQVGQVAVTKPKASDYVTILHITTGPANYPCSCGECTTYYGNNPVFPHSCNHTYLWPLRTCSNCLYNPTLNEFCMPCADIVDECELVNSWPYWKMVTVSVGDIPGTTVQQTRDCAWSPYAYFQYDWSDLATKYQQVVDEIC